MTDIHGFRTFPYFGTFFRRSVVGDSPLTMSEVQDVVLETICDLQSKRRTQDGAAILCDYAVYFPVQGDTNAVSINDYFRLESGYYGKTISGRVVAVEQSQLNAAIAYIKDIDVEEE